MSDQPKPAEIEDVLSSIRRLVAGGDAARTTPPGPPASDVEGPDAEGPDAAGPDAAGDEPGADLTAGPDPEAASAVPAAPDGGHSVANASQEADARAPHRDEAGCPDDAEAVADAAWSAAAESAEKEGGDGGSGASLELSDGATRAPDAAMTAAGAEGSEDITAEEARDDDIDAEAAALPPAATEGDHAVGDPSEPSLAVAETDSHAGALAAPLEDEGERDAACVDVPGGHGSDTVEASDERLSALVLTPALRIEPGRDAPGADSAGPAEDGPRGRPLHATSPVSPLLSRAMQAGGPASPRQGFGFGMGRPDDRAPAAKSPMISESADAHAAPGTNAPANGGNASRGPAWDSSSPPIDHGRRPPDTDRPDEAGVTDRPDSSEAAPRHEPIISRDFARRSPFRSRPAPGATPGAPAPSDEGSTAAGSTAIDGGPANGAQNGAAEARLDAQSAAEASAGQASGADTAAPDHTALHDDPNGEPQDSLQQLAADTAPAGSGALEDADTPPDDEGPLAPDPDTGQRMAAGALDGAKQGQGMSEPGAMDPEKAPVRPDATGSAAPFNLFGDEEGAIDEAALRAVVAEVVRDELKGALGERVSRNLRALVRREIARALTPGDIE
ncbi:MAG: hypothetical protein V2I65_14730 [Paracoccaceae bacterium]|jgi:hypothetical protein|nr:hypothetical protein [Paracoccaceae bacterium]